MPEKAERQPLPRIVKTVQAARDAAERARRDGGQDTDASEARSRGADGRQPVDEYGDQSPSGGDSGRRDRAPDPTRRRTEERHGDRHADRQRAPDRDRDPGSRRYADPSGSRDADPSERDRGPEDRSRDRRGYRDAERSRSADGERSRSGDGEREPDRSRRDGPDEDERDRRRREREADPTGGADDRDSSRGRGRREADPTDSDRRPDPTDSGRGGRTATGAGRARDLSVLGPFVTHFEGRVTQVFGTSQRPKPSMLPLTLGAAAVALAFALPYVLAWLPVIILVLLAYLWLRRRGWLRGGYRLPRQGGRPDTGLQITSFRVQIYDDAEVRQPFRSLDCRIVQSGEAGPAPLVGDETVVGHGVRLRHGLVELNSLRIGGKKGTRLRAARPSSSVSVALPALALFGLAGGVLYAEREVLAAFDPGLVVASVVQVLVIVVVVAVLLRFFRSRLRL